MSTTVHFCPLAVFFCFKTLLDQKVFEFNLRQNFPVFLAARRTFDRSALLRMAPKKVGIKEEKFIEVIEIVEVAEIVEIVEVVELVGVIGVVFGVLRLVR